MDVNSTVYEYVVSAAEGVVFRRYDTSRCRWSVDGDGGEECGRPAAVVMWRKDGTTEAWERPYARCIDHMPFFVGDGTPRDWRWAIREYAGLAQLDMLLDSFGELRTLFQQRLGAEKQN